MNFLTPKIRLAESGFFSGFTDYHNHILPGVDDGFRTIAESMEALGYFEALGVQQIIFTPHRMNGVRTSRQELNTAYENLLQEYKGKIQLSLAGEYMLDAGFEGRMTEGLLALEGDKVLVETSYFSPPNNFQELLFMVSVAGYTPVIAHPERYTYMGKRDYQLLKEKGYLLQLNLLSLSGHYGPGVTRKANFLLESGFYDIAGTDIHQLDSFKARISKMKITEKQLTALRRLV
ncbi:MAG: hypothetical protein H3C48_18045 [Chitinophagaceae bacterium]|nr:hypothetical protein [Chitinophagaceae bacterium]